MKRFAQKALVVGALFGSLAVVPTHAAAWGVKGSYYTYEGCASTCPERTTFYFSYKASCPSTWSSGGRTWYLQACYQN